VKTAIDDTAPASDGTLTERVRASDEAAFRLLFERYQPVLFRSMLATVGDRDESHEIVQETFVRVWRNRSSLRPDLPFLGYLFRIARNLVRDAAKRAAIRVRYEVEVPTPGLSESDDPEQALRVKVLAEALTEIIQRSLPDKCREVFVLSRMEGWSNAEIAGRLGISVKTVENQMTKALRIVRRELAAR
jgi:RNA polymerase sigma-70 factor (ECF subfamily)